MEMIRKNDVGAVVEDVQGRLVTLGLLSEEQRTGVADDATIAALESFCASNGIARTQENAEKIWSCLIDACYQLGDRSLYLRMPFFHGNDVKELQHALSALGFDCGPVDGIFGAHTELALRNFQMNMGLPDDGIVGAMTYKSLKNLSFTWADKPASSQSPAFLGFSRAAEVLEASPLCLFGTDAFSRSVASRMSNLALATNPASKIVSAESLSVSPDPGMLLVHIVVEKPKAPMGPVVQYEAPETLSLRLRSAISAATSVPPRITIQLPGTVWETAGEGRSAQHFAITLLDALCTALLPE